MPVVGYVWVSDSIEPKLTFKNRKLGILHVLTLSGCFYVSFSHQIKPRVLAN